MLPSPRLLRATAAALLLSILGPLSSARADEVVIRGNYWRDRNTRVIQPEVDIGKELPSGTTVGAHYLLDTITSASIAAGVVRDQAFTELRNEVGFRLGQRLGPTQHTVSYSYSSESDYWAHTLSIASSFDFFQKNSTLGLVTTYGSDTVAQRQGATVYNRLGGLQTFGFIASWTQVLSRTALLLLEYDASVLGFGSAKGKVTGSPNAETGFQGNAYRAVNLGGSPSRETVPFQRIRQSFLVAPYIMIPTGLRVVRYLAFRPSYRYYLDDWGVHAHTLELRTHLAIGPTELRLTGRLYTQSAADFANEVNGVPSYTDTASQGLPCNSCTADSSHGAGRLFYTADPKLSAFADAFVEGRITINLEPLLRRSSHPIPRWLSGGRVEVSFGHVFFGGYPHTAWGDANVGALSLAFPL